MPVYEKINAFLTLRFACLASFKVSRFERLRVYRGSGMVLVAESITLAGDAVSDLTINLRDDRLSVTWTDSSGDRRQNYTVTCNDAGTVKLKETSTISWDLA